MEMVTEHCQFLIDFNNRTVDKVTKTSPFTLQELFIIYRWLSYNTTTYSQQELIMNYLKGIDSGSLRYVVEKISGGECFLVHNLEVLPEQLDYNSQQFEAYNPKIKLAASHKNTEIDWEGVLREALTYMVSPSSPLLSQLHPVVCRDNLLAPISLITHSDKFTTGYQRTITACIDNENDLPITVTIPQWFSLQMVYMLGRFINSEYWSEAIERSTAINDYQRDMLLRDYIRKELRAYLKPELIVDSSQAQPCTQYTGFFLDNLTVMPRTFGYKKFVRFNPRIRLRSEMIGEWIPWGSLMNEAIDYLYQVQDMPIILPATT